MTHKALDLKALVKAEAPALDFVLPGLLRGTVGSLVSPGGLGKSYWSLQVALDVANAHLPGGAQVNLSGLGPKAGKVVYMGGEDPEVVVQTRLKAMAAYLPKNASYANLSYFDMSGGNCLSLTDGLNSFTSLCGDDTRLIILDTLSRFHNLDENSTKDMKRVVGQLESLAKQTKAAVLVLHHTSKQSVLQGTATLAQASRGSSVLTDNMRWSAYLSPMSEQQAKAHGIANPQEYVCWNISKQNYGPAQPDKWYRRVDGGVLIPVNLQAKSTIPFQAPQEVDVISEQISVVEQPSLAATPTKTRMPKPTAKVHHPSRPGYTPGGTNSSNW